MASETEVSTASSELAVAPAADDDPVTHLNYFGADAQRGRNAPSADFDRSADYVVQRLKQYGLVGPNPNDPSSPYYQTFNMNGFASERAEFANHADHGTGADAFGTTLFEHGFYLDDRLDSQSFGVLAQKYRSITGSTKTPTLSDLKASTELLAATRNVLGRLDGTGPKKAEVIVAMAHLDHLGVSGGQIYNGADDNGSGSSVLLSLVPILAAAKEAGQLNRTILFFWTAAEEDGLVGSNYFVSHPIAGIGLSNIVGVVNMDMVGRWDNSRISILDKKSNGSTTYLSGLLSQANSALATPFTRINKDIDAYARRQDGASFFDRGEDVLFVFEGLSNPNGGGNLHSDYHRPTDDVSKIIAENGGQKVRRIRDLVGGTLKLAANRP
ncbi:M28 family metallopeptidase [Pendulispora albinea]|uniref:M28 family peptidase n=1 Tax=Pendulispora albinea TaxID=2741071 RepID=A0ABZ2LRF4_9BACT